MSEKQGARSWMMVILKWMTVAGAGLLVIGYVGLSVAMAAYPDNNLLGGWALILGPLYWLGWLLGGLAVLGWLGAAIVVLLRRGRRSER